MNKIKHKIASGLLTLLVLPVLILTGDFAMAIEEPNYEVIHEKGELEYRRYAPFIIAQTIIDTNKRSEASNKGFRRLFNYISGDNSAQSKIEMTAPVIQNDNQNRAGTKIEMTAPVQQSVTEEGWVVAFVLPLDNTMASAPVPTNPDVVLREVKPRTMAVLRFSGRWTDKNVGKHEKKLLDALAESEIEIIGEMEFAAYNAPFALPFMRRNEVMVEIKDTGF